MLAQIVALLTFTNLSLAASTNSTDCPVNIPGYSRHGSCDLLCKPASWEDIVLFYLGNYVAHAATVTTDPGQSLFSSIATVVTVLMFPGAGIVKGLRAILSRAVFAPTELQQAARAGALYMVIKDKDVKVEKRRVKVPSSGIFRGYMASLKRAWDFEPEPVHTQSPETAAVDLETQGPANKTLIVTEEEHGQQLERKEEPMYLRARKLHGICILPKGFSLVPVPAKAKFEDDEVENRSYSPQSHLRWSIMWIFKPPPQRTSISCSYNLVKIAISIAQLVFACTTLYQTRGDQIASYGYAAFGLTVTQYAWMSFLNLIGNLLCPQYTSTFLVKSKALDELIDTLEQQGKLSEYPIHGAVGRLIEPETPMASDEPAQGSTSTGEALTLAEFTTLVLKEAVFSIASTAVYVGAVPLAIIGGLTGFSSGTRTRYQGMFTMTWLVFGFTLGPFMMSDPNAYRNRKGPVQPLTLGGAVIILLYFGGYAAPAVGGYIVVGQMIQEFGVCSKIT